MHGNGELRKEGKSAKGSWDNGQKIKFEIDESAGKKKGSK